MNKALPASDHEFMYLSKEYQGNKGMGKFMRELHEPTEIMPAFQDGKNYQKDNIGGKAGNQSNIIPCMPPVPTNSDTYIDCILSERCDEYSHVKNGQQTENCRPCDISKSFLHHSSESSSVFKAAILIPFSA